MTSEFSWVNPKYRFMELISLYNLELTQYLYEHDYAGDNPRKTLLTFFDEKGKGEEMREILAGMGV